MLIVEKFKNNLNRYWRHWLKLAMPTPGLQMGDILQLNLSRWTISSSQDHQNFWIGQLEVDSEVQNMANDLIILSVSRFMTEKLTRSLLEL